MADDVTSDAAFLEQGTDRQRFYIYVPGLPVTASFGHPMDDPSSTPFGYPGFSFQTGDPTASYFADISGPIVMQSGGGFINLQAPRQVSLASSQSVFITTASATTGAYGTGGDAYTTVPSFDPKGGSLDQAPNDYLDGQIQEAKNMTLEMASIVLGGTAMMLVGCPHGLTAGHTSEWNGTLTKVKLAAGLGVGVVKGLVATASAISGEVQAAEDDDAASNDGSLGGIWMHTEDPGGINLMTRGGISAYTNDDVSFVGGLPGDTQQEGENVQILPPSFNVLMTGSVSLTGTMGVDLFSPLVAGLRAGIATDVVARGPVGIASTWGPVNVCGESVRIGYPSAAELLENAKFYSFSPFPMPGPMPTRQVGVQAYETIDICAGSTPAPNPPVFATPFPKQTEFMWGHLLFPLINPSNIAGAINLTAVSLPVPSAKTPGTINLTADTAIKASVGPGQPATPAVASAALTPDSGIELTVGPPGAQYAIKINPEIGITIKSPTHDIIVCQECIKLATKDGTVVIDLAPDGIMLKAGETLLSVLPSGLVANKALLISS